MKRAPETREPQPGEDGRDTTSGRRVDPMMEAPDVGSGTSADAASWNPAQGDRSFGFGSGGQAPTESEADAAAGQGDMHEENAS